MSRFKKVKPGYEHPEFDAMEGPPEHQSMFDPGSVMTWKLQIVAYGPGTARFEHTRCFTTDAPGQVIEDVISELELFGRWRYTAILDNLNFPGLEGYIR